jgi:hypothetical protein
MPYKPKPKPTKPNVHCLKCGKLLTEYEMFFGLCTCQHPLRPQAKPKHDHKKEKLSPDIGTNEGQV